MEKITNVKQETLTTIKQELPKADDNKETPQTVDKNLKIVRK